VGSGKTRLRAGWRWLERRLSGLVPQSAQRVYERVAGWVERCTAVRGSPKSSANLVGLVSMKRGSPHPTTIQRASRCLKEDGATTVLGPPEPPSSRRRGYTAFGGACFRGAGPGSKAQTSARRSAVTRTGRRRRASENVARETFCSTCSPKSGATIPGTRRRPGQTDTRARGSTDHRPPTRHSPPTIGYQGLTLFSSFREPQGGRATDTFLSPCR